MQRVVDSYLHILHLFERIFLTRDIKCNIQAVNILCNITVGKYATKGVMTLSEDVQKVIVYKKFPKLIIR